MSVSRLKEEVGPNEMLRWQIKMMMNEEDAAKREWESKGRDDYQLALIAQQVYDLSAIVATIFGAKSLPGYVLDDFLLKFTFGDKPKAPTVEIAEGEVEQYKEWRANVMRGIVRGMIETPQPPPS